MEEMRILFKNRCNKNQKEDQRILEYIRQAEPEEYDTVLDKDGSWSVQYHLSPMRDSLFSWYPFEADAEVLEAGGAFGELTHILCEKCAYVTSVEREPVRAQAIKSRCRMYENLKICQCDIRDVQPVRKYDYVTAVGLLESQRIESKDLGDYAEFLVHLCSFLKPSGRLLLACENRMGIRYLCGERDGKTGIPYDGVRRYPQERGILGFTRMELEAVLEKAGITRRRFYYPLPDYRMVQAVYAEHSLPEDSVRDRVIPYYKDRRSVVASELDLMDFCIQSKCLHVFANSFLVECVLDEAACTDIESVFLTVDRGRPAAMAAIHEGAFMYKEALYPQGAADLARSVRHVEDLKRHGIRVVPHIRMSKRRIRMPYVEAPVLMSVLRDTLGQDAERFVCLMDQVWGDICRSSDVSDVSEDFLWMQQCAEQDWGPVLKNVYFDMVPMNCFYDEGEIVYFDQEFVRHDYPAKYTMFRVILYTYIHISEAENAVPRARMLRRYGISDVMWDVFFREETAFVSSLRKHEVFHHFHEMSQVSYEEMRENAKRLVEIEEAGYREDKYEAL